jgi:hypothetical protein
MASNRNSGYSSASSPVVYWSELETTEEEPYTIPVTEATPLIPWFRRKRDLERAQDLEELGFFGRAWAKFAGAVRFEVKASTDGLTTLFYEKVENAQTNDVGSEDSSDEPSPRGIPDGRAISRAELLNRGYTLCVLMCAVLSSIFGIIGLLLSGSAAGIAFVLVGFLVSISLELVSLVRFIM